MTGWGSLLPGVFTACELLILYSNLWKLLLVLVEVTNFHQRWPQFQRRLDHTHHIIHNPRDVLLEEIGFKPIKRARQILREQVQRLAPLRICCSFRGLDPLPMHASDLVENL